MVHLTGFLFLLNHHHINVGLSFAHFNLNIVITFGVFIDSLYYILTNFYYIFLFYNLLIHKIF